jgi:prepilin-type N-terminal cleavage/methylation domain-containing protein
MKLAPHSICRSQALGRGPNPVLLLFNAIFLQSRFLSGSLTRKSHERFGSWDFRASKGGFTLVEMTVVIVVILVLAGAASLGIKPYYAYRDGRAAGEALRSVKAAQLMYLSDYPATLVINLTQANLIPYMPQGTLPNPWPTLPPVNGVAPTINCTVFPPVAVLSGTTYDPSGSPTDGLWDVGQY